MPPQQERRDAKHDRRTCSHPGNRFMIRGEIKRDPDAKGDGHPGQQTPGAGFGAIHSRSFSMKGDHASKPAGATPPAHAVSRGGQVPAKPCVRPGALPRSAIRRYPPQRPDRNTI